MTPIVAAQRGFTLLEAIVALVIFSTAGLATFAWINSNLQTLARVQAANEEAGAKRNVLEFMQGVNPMKRGTGSFDFGRYAIRWTCVEDGPPRTNAGYPVGQGSFSVGAYRTTIDVARADGSRWFAFDLRQVGYARLGPASSALRASSAP